ncbi:MAG TPA: DMT family transporter [Bryobacteraceae bacterium]|nr:DMT family transporter [Bryobacteraceae bacterium]
MNGALLLYGLISLMILLWSANFIIAKVALREFPPLLLGALRISLAAVFLAPFYYRKARTAGKPLWPGAGLALLIFLGICNVGNQLLFLIGLNRTSVSHSALIIGIGPMFVLLIASTIGLERITLRKAFGMVIALGGVAALAQLTSGAEARSSGETQATLTGDAVTSLACILFAAFSVYGKKATERYGTIAVNGFAYITGAALLAPVILWQARGFPFAHVSAAAWSSLIYMALFPSAVCYLIYYYALTHISASRVSAFIYLEPVIATIMAVAFLGEQVTTPLVASGTVIFTGVYLTERG